MAKQDKADKKGQQFWIRGTLLQRIHDLAEELGLEPGQAAKVAVKRGLDEIQARLGMEQ